MRCFTAGTAVLTADGNVAIEDIESGDLVVARAAGLGRWEDLDHAPEGFPQAGDEVARLGTDVVGRVDALGAGATFVFEDGLFQTDDTGERIRWTGEVLAPVGDTMRRVARSRVELEVAYGDGHVGTITATPEHPFFVEGEGWVPLGDLVTGNVLAVEGGRAAVVVGLIEVEGGDVYNFEVLSLHNYHVGDGIVVHNSCPVRAGQGGRFGNLRGLPRDELTAHHMPQAALGFTPYLEGGALVLPRSLHELTRTYGTRGARTAMADAGRPFRSVLAADIRDVRRLAGSRYDEGIRELLTYYSTNFPGLMAK